MRQILLDDNFEPKISSLDLKFFDSQNEITGNPILMAPELICDVYYETISLSINVYSYTILLYSMFSNSKFEFSDNKPIRSPYRLQVRIIHFSITSGNNDW